MGRRGGKTATHTAHSKQTSSDKFRFSLLVFTASVPSLSSSVKIEDGRSNDNIGYMCHITINTKSFKTERSRFHPVKRSTSRNAYFSFSFHALPTQNHKYKSEREEIIVVTLQCGY